jgi:hypothetical protein
MSCGETREREERYPKTRNEQTERPTGVWPCQGLKKKASGELAWASFSQKSSLERPRDERHPRGSHLIPANDAHSTAPEEAGAFEEKGVLRSAHERFDRRIERGAQQGLCVACKGLRHDA